MKPFKRVVTIGDSSSTTQPLSPLQYGQEKKVVEAIQKEENTVKSIAQKINSSQLHSKT